MANLLRTRTWRRSSLRCSLHARPMAPSMSTWTCRRGLPHQRQMQVSFFFFFLLSFAYNFGNLCFLGNKSPRTPPGYGVSSDAEPICRQRPECFSPTRPRRGFTKALKSYLGTRRRSILKRWGFRFARCCPSHMCRLASKTANLISSR